MNDFEHLCSPPPPLALVGLPKWVSQVFGIHQDRPFIDLHDHHSEIRVPS